MANDEDEYRRQAEEAKRWADKVISPHDKAAWLRVAQGWLDLVKAKKSPKEPDRHEE